MNKNVVATSREGEDEFNFDQWLIKNDLTTLKSLFTKYGATSISSLQITSPEMQRLVVDMEFLSKPQLVPKVINATHQLAVGQKEVITVVLSEKEQAVIDDIKQKLNAVMEMADELRKLQSDYPKSQQRVRNMKMTQIEEVSAKINETFDALFDALNERKTTLLEYLDDMKFDIDHEWKADGNDDEKDTDEMTVCSQNIVDLKQFLKQKESEYNDSIGMKMSKEERQRVILKIGDDVNNRFGAKRSEIKDTTKMIKAQMAVNNKATIRMRVVPDINQSLSEMNFHLLNVRRFGAIALDSNDHQKVYFGGTETADNLHRIYFFSPDFQHSVHVSLSDLSPEHAPEMHKMCAVRQVSDNLMFLDLVIPWNAFQLPPQLLVSFWYPTCIHSDDEWYYIESPRHLSSTSKALLSVHYFDDQINTKNPAKQAVVEHLFRNIVDWESYRFSDSIWNSLETTAEGLSGFWIDQLKELAEKPSLVGVHRLQLLKSTGLLHSAFVNCEIETVNSELAIFTGEFLKPK